MAQQQFAGIAVFIAFIFLAMAVVACSSSEHVSVAGPVDIASYEKAPGTPEFHGADIGGDTLRGALPSEN